MLLPRDVPATARQWNRRWHAPFGNELAWRVLGRRRQLARRFPRLVGPFGFQANNDTRVIEYPWAYEAVALQPGMHAVELGGALSGFQFVLAKAGVRVTNVDPGTDAALFGGQLDAARIDNLNRAFHTEVELRNCTLQDAKLPTACVDVVYSISTIEHIPAAELADLMAEIARVLRPGGNAVLTIDLFLDLSPFTTRTQNRFGWNTDVAALVSASGLELTVGRRAELLGFAEFDPDAILGRLAEFYVGSRYPTCVQALVLTKR